MSREAPGVPNWLRGPSPDVREPEWVPRPAGGGSAELAALRSRVAEMRGDLADPRTFAALKAAFLDLLDILSPEDPAP